MANKQEINEIISTVSDYLDKISAADKTEQKQDMLLDLASDLFNEVIMPNTPYKGTVWVISYINQADSSREIYGCYSSNDAADEATHELLTMLEKQGYSDEDLDVQLDIMPVY